MPRGLPPQIPLTSSDPAPSPQTGDTILMPVPSSFNDITQNVSLKNYIGWVWYDREFWLPKAWTDNKTRVMLRLESAQYNAIGVSYCGNSVAIRREELKIHTGGEEGGSLGVLKFTWGGGGGGESGSIKIHPGGREPGSREALEYSPLQIISW